VYCGKSCAMAATRARQTPERRREIGRLGREAYQPEWQARVLARVKVFADTRDQQILLAYRFGRMALKTERHRLRRDAALTPTHADSTGTPSPRR
jgi:hypothetical protein